MRLIYAVCLFTVFFISQCDAAWRDLWLRKDQQAMRLLADGKASEAAKLFESKDWQASAHYKAKEYSQAEQLFKQRDDADGFYNQGNALALQGKYEDAIAAYDHALEKSPNMPDAVYNRELVKKMLQQEQKQQKPKKEPEKKQEQKEDKKDQNKNDQQQNKKDEQKDPHKNNEPDNNKNKQQDDEKGQDQPNKSPQDNGNNQDKDKNNKDKKDKPEDKGKNPSNNDKGDQQDKNSGNEQQQNQSNGKGSTEKQNQSAQQQNPAPAAPGNEPKQPAGPSPTSQNASDQLTEKDKTQKPGKEENSNPMLNNSDYNQGLSAKEKSDKEGGYAAKKKRLDEETDQWLQQIPDDPGSLLRRKIMRDHLKKMRGEASDAY